ncbi:Hypothetical predicted protein, partial [Paramuricea clavata]
EAFQFLSKQRRLDQQELEEVKTILSTRPNKKILQDHIRQKTGKLVTLRDIANQDVKIKSTGTNLEEIFGDISGTALEINNGFRDDLIEQYFKLGFSRYEILACLLVSHGIKISLSQLKRILTRRGLWRRGRQSPLEDVISGIEHELKGNGIGIGYRSMWQRLREDHELVVSRETVRCALKVIDPRRVKARQKHRLERIENQEVPAGRPEVLFVLPEMEDHRDLKVNVNLDELDMAVELCCSEGPELDCSVEFLQLAQIIMTEQIIDMPVPPEDARNLYLFLVNVIENIL